MRFKMKLFFLGLLVIRASLFATEDLSLTLFTDKWTFDNKYENEQCSSYFYTIEGETVNNWTELLTTINMNRINITLESYCTDMLSAIQSNHPNETIDSQVIDEDETSLFFEWWTKNQSKNPRHDWIRIINGEEKTFVICYSAKKLGDIEFDLKKSIADAKILDLNKLYTKKDGDSHTSYYNQMFSFKTPQEWTHKGSFEESIDSGTVFTHVFSLPEENGTVVIEDFPNNQNSSAREFLKMELKSSLEGMMIFSHLEKMKKENGSKRHGIVFLFKEASSGRNLSRFTAYYKYGEYRMVNFFATVKADKFKEYLPLFKKSFLTLEKAEFAD